MDCSLNEGGGRPGDFSSGWVSTGISPGVGRRDRLLRDVTGEWDREDCEGERAGWQAWSDSCMMEI